MISFSVPLIGFAAYSGTGKTTLLCKIIPLLTQKGIRVGIIKHAHHSFDIDHPKKDSCKLRESGASRIVVTSRKRTAIVIEHPSEQKEPSLVDALKNIHTKDLDLILIEGFKQADIVKIELHRKILNKSYLHPIDFNIIAIATDHDPDTSREIEKLNLNDPSQIADFIDVNIIQSFDLDLKKFQKHGE